MASPPAPAASPSTSAEPTGFGALLAVRVLTVLNDNLLRWLAIGLGKHAAGAAGVAVVLTVGTAGFVLPFVVLAWLAGWLADRHPKPRVIAWCKAAEVMIAAAAVATLWIGGGPAGPFAGWARLPAAAAALLGVAAAGWLASLALRPRPAADPAAPPPWNALARTWRDLADLARSPALAAAAAGIVFFWAVAAVAQLNVDQLVAESGARSQAQAIPMLVALVVGIACGSVAAGTISSRGADLGLVPLGGVIMAAASATLALGGGPLFTAAGGLAAGYGLTAAALWLLGFGAGLFDVPLEAHFQATAPAARRGALLAALNLLTFAGMLVASLLYGLVRSSPAASATLPPALWLLLATVIVIGCQAALLAPAVLGSIPETVPARRLAHANGIFAMATLAATLAGMAAGNWLADADQPEAALAAAAPLVSARGVFGIFALAALGAAAAAVWCAPRATLRLFVAALVHAIWRFRVRDERNVPTAGPAVVVANHLSWLDGFLLPLSCPRHLRMVVYGPNIRGRFLRMLADQWRFILFDPRPKSIGGALKAIQGGIADGDAIGIFCEGGISRHGQIIGFKRGLEWILERASAPLVPLHIDGLWGSLLTFSEGRYFTKWPRLLRRTITLTYGTPLPAGTHPDEARLALQELSAHAVRRRLAAAWPERAAADDRDVDWPALAATAEAFDGCCLVRRDDRLFVSLGSADPLHAFGRHAARLLAIGGTVCEGERAPADLAAALAASRATLWLANVEQVAALAALGASAGALAAHLQGVVIPIGAVAELPAASAAAAAFQAACGIEPVVAYAPPEAGGLVAMNTPPARVGGPHETTCKPATVGRVVNGVVVWPRAAMRPPLGLASLAAQGVPDDDAATLVIAATLPGGANLPSDEPRAFRLADRFDVDGDGFLIAR